MLTRTATYALLGLTAVLSACSADDGVSQERSVAGSGGSGGTAFSGGGGLAAGDVSAAGGHGDAAADASSDGAGGLDAASGLAPCTNPPGTCITACIRVNEGAWTSSSVTISTGDFVEFRPEPLAGNSADFNAPDIKFAQQCSDLLEAKCPSHFGISPGHGTGTGSVVAYRPLDGEWWQQDKNCRDDLQITVKPK